MRTRLYLLALLAAATTGVAAQANVVQGLDGNLDLVDNLTFFGHQGTWPNGRTGMAMLNEMCNPGSVRIPWQSAMLPDHPKFGFLICRQSDGRFVQISDRSCVKHAFLSTNYSGPCGTCQHPGTNQEMGIHCADAYSEYNNADQFYLAPADEIDPWLGTWVPRASYFDRGDPDVGYPQNQDGVRSLTQAQAGAFPAIKNLVNVADADLTVANATYYYGIHLVHQGEAVANRGNNLASRRFVPSWNGSRWNFGNSGGQQHGSILQWWSGAALALGGNGQDDGRFAVAVKVTGPVDGRWHYEYAVHNIDNSRGGASLRVPLCSTARVWNSGFRDIDGNPLNDWSMSRQGGEWVFAAPAGNALDWNLIFNFWFDSDAAPVAGQVQLDEARLGAGALSVAVPTQVPMSVPNVWLGAGCGAPVPELRGNGIASSPNPGFALDLDGAPSALVLLCCSWVDTSLPLPGGCTQYLDPSLLSVFAFAGTDAQGRLHLPVPIPAGLPPGSLSFQALQLQPQGPLFGQFALGNGLRVRFGLSGCP